MTKPTRISWSAIRAHEECHEKSFLQRDGKRSKVTNIRNFFPGILVDSWMREYLNDPRDDAVDLIKTMMDEQENIERDKGNIVRFRDADDRNQIRAFCTTLVTRLIPILQQHVVPYEHTCGKWFKVPLNLLDANNQYREVLLTGEMDLLVNNDGPIVWDLKGTADDQYWRKVIGQLVFYDLALYLSTSTKTRHVGLIQPMCAEQTLTFKVTDDQRRDLMLRIQRYALDVWAGERSCTDNTGTCHWCDVRHACSRFQQPRLDTFGDLAAGLNTAAGETA